MVLGTNLASRPGPQNRYLRFPGPLCHLLSLGAASPRSLLDRGSQLGLGIVNSTGKEPATPDWKPGLREEPLCPCPPPEFAGSDISVGVRDHPGKEEGVTERAEAGPRDSCPLLYPDVSDKLKNKNNLWLPKEGRCSLSALVAPTPGYP